MTNHAKYKSPYNSWSARFLYLPVPGAPDETQRKTEPKSPEPTRRSWRAALRCRFRKKAVDRELLAGADTNSSECRRRRASEMIDRRTREALAVAYVHLLVGL